MTGRRRGLGGPIVFGTLAIAFTITILVAWNIMFTRYFVLATETRVSELGVGYWMILSIGDVFLVGVATILVLFLIGNVRQRLYIRRQETFLDSVTHELKSPLASLRLSLDTFARRETDAELTGKLLGMMRGDVGRLERFVENLLEAGRIEHGEHRVEREPTPLIEVIDACVERMTRRLGDDRRTFQVVNETGDDDPVINTDPIALEVVLLNLLDNATKYSVDDEPIRVTLMRESGRHVVEVTDSGIGIPAKELNKVFRRFYRVSRHRRRDRGTGLGLHVVQALVKRMRGRVSAHSEGEGKGSTFRLELPA